MRQIERMTSDERRRAVQRLASMAQTMAEMGYGDDLARGHLIAAFRTGVGLEKASTDVGVVREAAAGQVTPTPRPALD
jgi:hypothetical protein